jgi:glyoxylase-like metal-dependent hydrolase (beta-lactamase superfamily II)|tara:strand:+ start:870 stop:1532 length:663 start_codon:yes stop_codon:yes gene_type:complete
MKPTTDFAIRSFIGGYDNNFTYIITCMQTGVHTLVDAAIKLDQIKPFIRSEPTALLVTHTHGDHIAYLDDYTQAFPNIVIVGHPESQNKLDMARFKPVKNNSEFSVGRLKFQAIHTPGHYFDSVCYTLENVIFTGDTLFVGRTGRTISARSNIKYLYDSVYNKILALPSETQIYPGHDYGPEPSITIEKNIAISPLLQAEDEQDFISRMDKYERTRIPGK